MRSFWTKIAISLIFSAIISYGFLVAAYAKNPSSYALPSKIEPSAKYLFFIHNRYIEEYGPSRSCDYHGIVKAFQSQGFTVISEIRDSDVSPESFAEKVARQVKTLLAAGVPPENITVSGHSKGGYITLVVSEILRRFNKSGRPGADRPDF